MKKQNEINFSKISKEQTDVLTTVVNETIARDFVPVKSFSVVDLWNIRRNRKTTMNSRNFASFL